MNQIKLKIDIKNGTIDIESDSGSFDAVMQRAEAMLDKFAKIDHQTEPVKPQQDHEPADEASGSSDRGVGKTKSRKKGPAKVASWKIVPDLLDVSGRKDLKAFYEQKAPTKQNDQVAVLIFKLKELTGREGFDGNETHTAFQIVGEKTPGNLTAVFGNMTGGGLGSMKDKKFFPNFKADDLVNHDLPRSAAKK